MIITEFSLKLDNISRLFISEKLLDYNDDDDTIHLFNLRTVISKTLLKHIAKINLRLHVQNTNYTERISVEMIIIVFPHP